MVLVMVTLLSDVIFGTDNAFFDALDLRCALDDRGLLRHHLLNTPPPVQLVSGHVIGSIKSDSIVQAQSGQAKHVSRDITGAGSSMDIAPPTDFAFIGIPRDPPPLLHIPSLSPLCSRTATESYPNALFASSTDRFPTRIIPSCTQLRRR